jgi:ADP-ribose pyrophosphatase
MSQKIEPWREISREVVFEKFGRGIEKVIFEQSDGEKVDLYLKKERDTVAVVAMTDTEEIIMVRQFRPGPRKVVLDLPGGIVSDENMTQQKMQDSMKNELLEETGYEGKLQFVSTAIECGYSSKKKYAFIATDCKRIREISNDLRDNDKDGTKGFKEEKEVVLVSLKKFRKLLQDGQFADVQIGYLALDYLGLL